MHYCLANAGRQALLMNEVFVFFCVLVTDLSFLTKGGLAPRQGEVKQMNIWEKFNIKIDI